MTRPKRLCVKPVPNYACEDEKENMDFDFEIEEHKEEKKKEEENQTTKPVKKARKAKKKIENDEPSCEEDVTENIVDYEPAFAVPQYYNEIEMLSEDIPGEKAKESQIVIREKGNNIIELNNYWPYGLECDSPVNEELLFLFQLELKNNLKFCDKCEEGKASRERGYFEAEQIIKYSNSSSFEFLKKGMRPKESYHSRKLGWSPICCQQIDYPDHWGCFSYKSDIYYALTERDYDQSFGYFRSPLIRIFVQNKTACFYLKVDAESIPQIPKSVDMELSYQLSYHYLFGKYSSFNEPETLKITDTFDFPEAVIPPGLTLTLRDYQLRSISWMKSIEACQDNDYNTIAQSVLPSDSNCPFKVKLGNTPWYVNLGESRYVTKSPVTAPLAHLRFRGGILADDTGSGKTITTLGLIHSSPFNEEQARERALRYRSPSKTFKSRASCIICPSNIYTQWLDEARKLNPSFRVIGFSTIHDHKKVSWYDVINADVVVVSYQFLQRRSYSGDSSFLSVEEELDYFLHDKGRVYLGRIFFHRLILDEFHELETLPAVVQDTICIYKADYVWGLTGTPKIGDLEPHQVEVRVKDSWGRNRTEHRMIGDLEAQLKYFKPTDAFMNSFRADRTARNEFVKKFIKRNVPDLKLPQLENEVVWVDLSPQETVLMDFQKRNASLKEQIMMCSHYQLSEKKTISKNEFISIEKAQEQLVRKNLREVDALKRQVLDEVNYIESMIKNHPDVNIEKKQASLKEIEKRLQSAENSYNYCQSVFKMIGEPDKNECSICYDKIPKESLSILPCSHIYCYECVILALKRLCECPLCHYKLKSESEVHRIKMKKKEVLNQQLKEIDLSKYGSKLIALYNYLTTLIASDPEARVILFLQYSDLADFMAETFKELRINCARVAGNVFQRRNAINKFKESQDCRLIMMSSEDSVSGINLTEATHVILLHPFYTDQGESVDLAYEKQGISRAYRSGLNHPLKVIRFAVRSTVEEAITLRRQNIKL